jgi:hypothetical protein
MFNEEKKSDGDKNSKTTNIRPAHVASRRVEHGGVINSVQAFAAAEIDADFGRAGSARSFNQAFAVGRS